MQKLKKSLENNILKTIYIKSPLIFNLEISSNRGLAIHFNKHSTKTLTTNSSKWLKLLCNLEEFDLKHPIVLKIFETNNSLNQYFTLLEEKIYVKNTVVTKSFNKVFKNNSYSVVKDVNSERTFLKLRDLLNPQINLLRILKLKLTRKKF
jgi:hypothetical protein